MNLIWQFICNIFFITTCWTIGDILFKFFLKGNISLSPLGRYPLAFITGNVVISYLLTFFGFIGGFSPLALWTIFLGGIGISILYIIEKFRNLTRFKSVNHPVQEALKTEEIKWRDSFIFLVVTVGFFLLPAILQAAAPPYMRDSLVYHLFCPKEYLRVGKIVYIEGNIFSAFPKGHEVLMTLLLSIGGDRAAQGFSIPQQISVIGVLYTLTRTMAGPLSPSFCIIGYATIPPVIYFSGCGYVEAALLMALGGSLLVLFLFLQSVKEKNPLKRLNLRMVSLIGLLGGWMVAIKYSGLIYLGLIGLILFWSFRKETLKRALTVIGTFSISATPGFCWMAWNWVNLGNPVYPMAWFLFGGKDWDEARAIAMSIYFDTYGMGKGLRDYLLLIWRLAFSGRFDSIQFDGAIGPFLIIFLALAVVSAYLLIHRWIRHEFTKQIGFMFIVSAAFFVFGTQQTRFWLPSQMLICTFVAPSLEFLIKWVNSRKVIKVAMFLVIIACLLWNLWFLGKQFLAVGYYKPVLGWEQERDFLMRKVPGYTALEFINQNLPKSIQLMCIWTGTYGYYIDRKFYSDTFIEDITIKSFIQKSTDGKELSKRLTQAGFTHLFLNLPILEKNLEQSERVIFNNFLLNETQEIFHHQNYKIYEICQQ